MIVQLRGTSGSGKSTIVRAVMSHYKMKEPFYKEGRRQPLGYNLIDSKVDRPLMVLGHYESPCGGCDTISMPGSMDFIFERIRAAADMGGDVLFEGVIIGDDTKRSIQLHKDGYPFVVIGLTTPLADCLAGVQSRRDARGDTRPLGPENTANRIPRIKGHLQKLKTAGVATFWCDRAEALRKVEELLGVAR